MGNRSDSKAMNQGHIVVSDINLKNQFLFIFKHQRIINA